jgi:ATP/maltotriose-dependent transcriptional regulator MalT
MNGSQPSRLLEPLSPREVEILRLLKDGLSNQEVVQALLISLETVKWYNRQIYTKLGVNNRARAVEKARQSGLFGLPELPPEREPLQRGGNLPAVLSSFIGRKTELAELSRFLRSSATRLVTLTGPGGVGKTSTAIQLGGEL